MVRLINMMNWYLSANRRGENGLANVFKDKIAVHRLLSVFRSAAYKFSWTYPQRYVELVEPELSKFPHRW